MKAVLLLIAFVLGGIHFAEAHQEMVRVRLA